MYTNINIFDRVENAVSGKLLTRNNALYKALQGATLGTVLRPVWTSGTGRYKHNENRTWIWENILNRAGITFASGNDAPRGGACGNYIVITGLKN